MRGADIYRKQTNGVLGSELNMPASGNKARFEDVSGTQTVHSWQIVSDRSTHALKQGVDFVFSRAPFNSVIAVEQIETLEFPDTLVFLDRVRSRHLLAIAF